MTDTLRVYHNARCSKSRAVCALLQERGLPLEVVVADTSRGPALIHAMRMRTQYVKLLEGGRQWT